MRFGNPYFLTLLWLVPALLFFYLWAFRRKQVLIEKFVTPELKERLLKGVSFRKQRLKAFLVLVTVLLVILALIRPKWGFHWEEVKRRGVDIMVALDVSQSMMAKDVAPNRLERAKREIIDLLNIIVGDRVGLIAFAGTSFLQSPLTLDHGAVQIFLDYLSSDLIPVPGTAIGGAIDEAIKAFGATSKNSRALILITDGEDHSGKPLEAAKRASEAGIKVYAVGIGKEGGAPIPNPGGGFKKNAKGEVVLTQLDEETLQKVALETGGSYVRSVSGDLDLEKIYEDIRSNLEEKELSSGRRKRFEERYQWPLLLAFLLLIFEALLPERKRAEVRGKMGFSFRSSVLQKSFVFLLFVTMPSQLMGSSAREGNALYEQGKHDEALDQMLDAQIQDPQNLDIKYNLANNYYKLGQYEEAHKLFESVAKSSQEKLSQQAYYNLGNTAYRMGKLQDALAHYEKALALDPKDEDAKFNLEFVRKEIKRRIEEQKKTAQKQQQQQQQAKNQQQQQGQKSQQNNPSQQGEQQQEDKGQQKEQEEKKMANAEQEEKQGNENQEKNSDESQQGAESQPQKARQMSEEEARQWLSGLSEDRKKFMKKQLQGARRYRVEKDW